MHTLPKNIMALASLAACAACSPAPEATENTASEAAPAIAAADEKPGAQITGTVTYRERMALGPTAQLNIQLQDVSLADVAATIIAEKTISDFGQVPIRFELEYDPTKIEQRNTYVLRAVIRDNGKMLFTTDTAYPVITRDNINSAEIMLIRVNTEESPTSAQLTDTYWQLSAINGTAVVTSEERRSPYLQFISDNNVTQGFSGCNQFSGKWTLTNGRIELGPMAMTMMACADSMETETAFMQALDSMDKHEIQTDELRMFQGDTEVLLFKAVPQP